MAYVLGLTQATSLEEWENNQPEPSYHHRLCKGESTGCPVGWGGRSIIPPTLWGLRPRPHGDPLTQFGLWAVTMSSQGVCEESLRMIMGFGKLGKRSRKPRVAPKSPCQGHIRRMSPQKGSFSREESPVARGD